VTKRLVTDVAASVRQRLSNNAMATRRPFQEVLQHYAMERFLYRLAQSPHLDKFVLKGALMLSVWRAPTTRPTRDIDLLGCMPNDPDAVASVIREVCQQRVEPDGLVFDPQSVTGQVIKEDADYEGVRIAFRGTLQNSRIAMQIDVGFGDVIVPGALITEYPTILDQTAPRLRGYSRETTAAEKFEAMVKLGSFNSRMKDFFDIWLLSRQFEFDGRLLARAIQETFANRGTSLPVRPTALTAEFATDRTKQSQWQAFLQKSRLTMAPASLAQVVQSLASFLGPVVERLRRSRTFAATWQPPGPWNEHPDDAPRTGQT
jgi:hypothetical protein